MKKIHPSWMETYYYIECGTGDRYRTFNKKTMRSVMRLARKVLAKNPKECFQIIRHDKAIDTTAYIVIVKNGKLKRIKGWKHFWRWLDNAKD